jgi:hypothetical protein
MGKMRPVDRLAQRREIYGSESVFNFITLTN